MPKLKWKDASTYQKGDDHSVKNAVVGMAGKFRIVITRWIHGEPLKWYLTWALDDRYELASTDLEMAKQEALAHIEDQLAKAIAFVQ